MQPVSGSRGRGLPLFLPLFLPREARFTPKRESLEWRLTQLRQHRG